MNSRIPLLSSYLVENTHGRNQPSPGPHVNFHGISQVGEQQLEGDSREGQSQKTAVASPCRILGLRSTKGTRSSRKAVAPGHRVCSVDL